MPKRDEVNEAPISSRENLADLRAVCSSNGVVTVRKTNGSIHLQIHDHFRPSDPANKSMHVARLVVLRIGHELNATVVEATHPVSSLYPSALGFSTLLPI
jgi:hypothetical protein